MLVRELIQQIENKETNAFKIGKEYGISDKTVQSRLKAKGFTYEASRKIWVYEGNSTDKEAVFSLKVSELLKSRQGRHKEAPKKAVEMQQGLFGEETPVNAPEPIEKPQKEPLDTTADKIDSLLNDVPTEKNERLYRGFYFDTDVLEVIDGISRGNKSDLINEILRTTFKERGRL